MPVFTKGDQRLLFIHVPKTGGTYIEDLFRANDYKVDFWKPNRLKPVELVSPQHYHATVLAQVFDLGQFDAIFMTVRHPVKRLFSEYKMRVPGGDMDLSSWLDETFKDYDADRSSLDNHLRPQSEFLLPGTHVFKQEDGFGAPFIERLTVELGIELAVEEVSRRRDNRDWHSSQGQSLTLSETMKSRVLEEYASDFETFEYPIAHV